MIMKCILILILLILISLSSVLGYTSSNINRMNIKRNFNVLSSNNDINKELNNNPNININNNNDDMNNSNVQPTTIRSSLSKPLTLGLGWLAISGGILGSNMLTTNMARAKSGGKFPIIGNAGIMNAKSHGTSEYPVQNNLRWKCDEKLADRICNYNRHYAEFAGYWTSETTFLKENDGSVPITFYDSVTGAALFKAPVGRTWDEFVNESRYHGWPSFRDQEVVWDNVRSLNDGEMVSLTGTHLGHNLPDNTGNRYCINLVSIAGNPIA